MTLETSMCVLFTSLIFSVGAIAYMLVFHKPFTRIKEEKDVVETSNEEFVAADKTEDEK
ncbi:hypothetical protein ACS2B2_25620 [Bacillus cereus group sp. BceL297]|uniref:hypothetical protein n=1 Tax=unclassified Bacillus cereus group TaxID=2750818 RepID=UPI003F1EEB3E